MKKIFFIIQLTAVAILFSPMLFAHDYDNGEHHGHGWGRHHHHHYYPRPIVRYYYPQPVIRYYPQPQVRYYPQPSQYSYGQRSHQGLAGGVIGGVFGYELGNGDPIATGLGAAAGSFIANEIGGN